MQGCRGFHGGAQSARCSSTIRLMVSMEIIPFFISIMISAANNSGEFPSVFGDDVHHFHVRATELEGLVFEADSSGQSSSEC